MSPLQLSRRTPGWGLVGFTAVLLVWAALALGQLNALLAAMHVSGSPPFTISDLNRLAHVGPDREQATSVLQVWKSHATDALQGGVAPGTADAHDVIGVFVLVDSALFVPLYVLLLVSFFSRARAGLETAEHAPGGAEAIAPLRTLARAGIALIVVAGCFDLVENLCYYLVVDHAWAGFPGAETDYGSPWFTVPLLGLWITAFGKWLTAVGAVLAALMVGWALAADAVGRWRERGVGKASGRLHLVGFQIATVVVAVVLLNQQGQIADLIRRWQAPQLLLVLFLLTFAGYTIWAVTRRLLMRGTWQPAYDLKTQRRRKRQYFGVFIALAAAQLGLHRLFDDARIDPGWGLAVPAVILIVLAALGVPLRGFPRAAEEVSGRRPSERAAGVEQEPVLPRLLAAALIVGFSLALLRASFGYATYTRAWSAWAIVVLLVAPVGAVVLPRLAALAHLREGVPKRALAEPLTGAAAFTLIALALLAPWRGGDVNPSLLVALSALLAFAGGRWFVALGHEVPLAPTLSARASAVVGAVVLTIAAAIVVFPLEFGDRLGGVGVVAAFLVALTIASGTLTWIASGIPLPRVMRVLRLRRFPITTVLVVWFVVASLGDRTGSYHDAGLQPARSAAAPLTVRQAFACWLGRNGLAPLPEQAVPQGAACAPARAGERSGATPLIFVSSTGGGIRSAYWTATALDCAFEIDAAGVDRADPCPSARRSDGFAASDALFAVSGISGGSLGLAEYAAHLVAKERGTEPADWVRQRLEVDGLSPAGAWWLFVEIPRVFLQFDSPDDRAAVLERAWERRWPGRELELGLFEVAREHPRVPFLLLNSTSVGDGCRFNVSVLDANIEVTDPRQQYTCRSNAPFDESPTALLPVAGVEDRLADKSVLPATRDLSDLLCLQPVDLNLSTAALLSARFPYVNPSGRVPSQCPDGDRRAAVHAVDGGYLDTSGASPVVELTESLRPLIDAWNADPAHTGSCIVPFAIQIDNGFEDSSQPRSSRRPTELTTPPQAVFDTRIGRAAEARSLEGLIFNRSFPAATLDGRPLDDRYAHFVNQAHPGPAAPFGWAQSRFSQSELERQLQQAKNVQALSEIRSWRAAASDGRLRCR